jgi:hypothetical protein
MYLQQTPHATDANAAEIDVCTQKFQAAASAIPIRINWPCEDQVFRERMIFVRHNSHIWPETNRFPTSVHWYQQRFAVKVWRALCMTF